MARRVGLKHGDQSLLLWLSDHTHSLSHGNGLEDVGMRRGTLEERSTASGVRHGLDGALHRGEGLGHVRFLSFVLRFLLCTACIRFLQVCCQTLLLCLALAVLSRVLLLGLSLISDVCRQAVNIIIACLDSRRLGAGRRLAEASKLVVAARFCLSFLNNVRLHALKQRNHLVDG